MIRWLGPLLLLASVLAYTAPTTSQPTQQPTAKPTTQVPTKFPTLLPTLAPTTSVPTNAPTTPLPTANPTLRPTRSPTLPTSYPTLSPTKQPTTASPVTTNPTRSPTTALPTSNPVTSSPTSVSPTTISPTSKSPTLVPTRSPTTAFPTRAPTYAPTAFPTKSPTYRPTRNPTHSPTSPTLSPTKNPVTASPTQNPTPVYACPYATMPTPASVEVEDCAGLVNLKTAFTVSMWVKLNSPTPNPSVEYLFQAQPPTSAPSSAAYASLAVRGDRDAYAWVSASDTIPSSGGYRFIDNSYQFNKWVHLIMSWQASPGTVAVYNAAAPSPPSPSTSQPGQLVGNERIVIFKGAMSGAMKEFTLYNRVVSAAERQGLYWPGQYGSFPPLANLVLLLYEDLANNRFVDISPNSQSLTVSGTVSIENSRLLTVCNADQFCSGNKTCLRAEFYLTCVPGGCPLGRGVCMDSGGTTTCNCLPGYYGANCQNGYGTCNPTTKVFDSYAKFGGLTDFIRVEDCTLDLTSSDFTISFWALPSAMVSSNPVFSTGDRAQNAIFVTFTATGLQFGWGPTPSNSVSFSYRCAASSTQSVVSQSWHFIVARYQRAGPFMDLWVDGQLAQNVSVQIIPSRFAPLYIGYWKNSNDYYYRGLLDQFRIHQRLLTTTEIANMILGISPANNNLIAYFSFDDGVRDLSARPQGSFIGNATGGITIEGSNPVCRPINTCNPDPCGNGTCGLVGASAVCTCYTNQGFFLNSPTNGVCTKFKDPATSCNDDGSTVPVLTANFRSTAECVQFKPCAVNIATPNSFSIEVWFRRNGTGRATILSRGTQAPNLFFGFDDSQNLQFGWGTSIVSFYCGLLKDNWHHVAAVYNSTYQLLYIDGVLMSAVASTGTLSASATDSLFLGCSMVSAANSPFVGALSQLHLYGRALTASDVAAHYTHSYTASNSAGMLMDLLLDGDTFDRAALSRSLKTRVFPNSSVPDFSTFPFCMDTGVNPCAQGRPCGPNGSCRPGPTPTTSTCACRPGYFGGNCSSPVCPTTTAMDQFLDLDGASYLTVQTCDASFFTNNSFAISMWVKAAPGFKGPGGLLGHGERNQSGLGLGFTSTLDMSFGWGAAGTTATLRCSAGEDWHLLVAMQVNNVLTLYMDGISGGPVATQNSGGAYTRNTRDFLIGAWRLDGALQYFAGQIDEVRIYGQGLTLAQVIGLQTNILPFPVSLVLYLPMNGPVDMSQSKSPVVATTALPLTTLFPPASDTRSLCFTPTPSTTPCYPNPCGVNSLCSQTSATLYTCTCAPGYQGTNCASQYDVNTICLTGSKFAYGAFNTTSRLEIELTSSPLFLSTGLTIAFYLNPIANTGTFLNYGNVLTMSHSYPDMNVAWGNVTKLSACGFPYASWRHYALTINSAGSMNLFVNGVSIKTATLTSPEAGFDMTAFPLLTIGGSGWSGYLSNFRIYRSALSSTNIGFLSTASNQFLVPPDMLIPFALRDSSYTYRHASAGGVLEYSTSNPIYIRNYGVKSQDQTPTHCRAVGADPCNNHPCNYGSCLATSATTYSCTCFRGYAGPNCADPTSAQCQRSPYVAQGYVEFPPNSNATLQISGCGLQFNRKNFTFSTWVLRNVDGTYSDSLFRFASLGLRFKKPLPGSRLGYFEYTFNNASFQVLLSGWNGWRHIAATYSYTAATDNGQMALFIDGRAVAGSTGTKKTIPASSSLNHAGHDVWVGPGTDYNYDTDPNYLQGAMSDLRLYDTLLTDQQILYLYDNTQNGAVFVPSTNLQIHMLMTNTTELLGLAESSPNARGVNFERYKLREDNIRDVAVFGNAALSLSQDFPLCRALNPCYPNPCVHGACSVVGGTNFACQCTPTWSGATCATFINRTTTCTPGGLAHGHVLFGALGQQSDYALSVPRCELEFREQNFSFSGWFFPFSPDAGVKDLFIYETAFPKLQLQGNTLSFAVSSATSITYTICEFNEWIHVAAVFDLTSTNITLFVNGNLVVTTPAGLDLPLSDISEGSLLIGRNFRGYVSNLALFQRVLSPSEVSNLQNNMFDRGDNALVLYLPLSSDFQDYSPRLLNASAAVAPTEISFASNYPLCFPSTNCFPNPCYQGICSESGGGTCRCFPGYYGPRCNMSVNLDQECIPELTADSHGIFMGLSSLDVDGSATRITAGFTISMFVRIQGDGSEEQVLFSNPNLAIHLGWTAATVPTLEFSYGTLLVSTRVWCRIVGKWVHIAGTYDRSSSRLSLYLDEQLRAQTNGTAPTEVLPVPMNSFLIGETFTGRMDEVRFYERALSAGELALIRQNNAPTDKLDFYLPMSNNATTFHDYAGTERYTPKLVDANVPLRLRVVGAALVSNGEYPLCLPPALPCYPNPCIFGSCKPLPATMQPTPVSYDPDRASWVNPQYDFGNQTNQTYNYQCVCFPGYTGPTCALELAQRACSSNENQCGVFTGANILEDNMDLSGQFTVSAWAYVENPLQLPEFMRHSATSTSSPGLIFGFNAGTLTFGYLTPGKLASVALGSAVQKEWHHYAATLRSSGPGNSVEYVIFIDGVNVAAASDNGYFTDIVPTFFFQNFEGRIDNFRVLNLPISNAEALSQYSTGSYPSTNTLLWLPFGTHERPDFVDPSLSWVLPPTLDSTKTFSCLEVRVVPGSVVPILKAEFGAVNHPDWCTSLPCNAIYAYHDSVLNFSMVLNQIDSNGLPLPPVDAYVTSVGFKTETFGRLFPCQSYSAPSIRALEPVKFTCETPIAGGNELQFVIGYCLFPAGPCFNSTLIPLTSTLLRGPTNTTFRYPQPTIDSVSLMRISVAGETRVPLNRWTAKKQGSENFTFMGTYFLKDPSLMSITYGPVSDPFKYQTVAIYTDPTYIFTENRVVFSTDGAAVGFDLVFSVNVAGVVVTGTDTYSYPEQPEVYTVSGCNVTQGNETLDCPTYGRVLVTIVGKGFVDQKGNGTTLQLFADVSGATCTNLTLINSAMLTCILPPGAGLLQPVRVFSLGYFSNPKPLVSYGVPKITQMRGGSGNVSDMRSCSNTDDLNIHHCPRFEGTQLTIMGENFGVGGAVIILGVRQCQNVTHTDPLYHTEVQCTMPRGNQQHQPVLLIVERGEISKSQATIGYAPCPPGFFENSTDDQKLCTKCRIGEFSDNEGAIGACPLCAPGSVSSIEGASTCLPCDKGRYQGTSGMTECLACEPGKFAGTQGLDACSNCPPGKANSGLEDSSKCADCVQGRVQPTEGKSSCDACPAGKTSNSQLLDCAQCVAGSVAPLEAAATCVLCQTNSYPSSGSINCECDIGLYGQFEPPATLEANPEKVICIKCPVGAACEKRGIWRWNIPALPGYWHESNDALNFEPCLFGTHCPGQSGGNETGCASNRFGLLCANCKQGYKSTGGAAPCDECPEAAGESWGWSFLFVIGIFFGLAVVYYIVLRADAQQDRAFSGKIGEVKLSSLPPILNMGDAGVLTTNLVLTEENQRTSRFTSTLKIVVGFFQICTSLSVFNDVKLPTYYATFIGAFNVINLDFVPWTSLSCVANFNFFTKTLLTGFIPILLVGSCTAGFFGWYKLAEARDFSDDPGPRKRRKGYRLRFWKLLLFTLFLLYPSVSSSILRYFVCREINSSYWLLADLNMLCGPGIWLDNLPYVAMFVLVYPIGIPTMFFILMFRRRAKLRRVNTIQTYSFLYQAYIEKVWFFEEIEMVHKLIMTSILQFFPGAMRFQAGMVVTYLYICAILLVSPYVQKKNEILAIICEIEIMLLLLAGNAMSVVGKLPEGSFLDILLSILLIGATIFAILLFIATAIHHARQNYWTKKRLNAEKAGKRNRVKAPHELDTSETSVISQSSKNSEGVSEIDDSDMGESENIKTAREAQEAMQDALQSTLSEQIVPFYMVVIESCMTIWDDIRRKPCCKAIMRPLHRAFDPCSNRIGRGWDNFVRIGQQVLSRLGCIRCAAYFRRLTCGTCCEKRKAGKPKLYTSAMMELMLPEARHQRSASEHLLRSGNDLTATKHDIPDVSVSEDDEDAKFDVVTSQGGDTKALKSALKKPKEAEESQNNVVFRKTPDAKPVKPRKLTVDETKALFSAAKTDSSQTPSPQPNTSSSNMSPSISPATLPDQPLEEKKLDRALSIKQADAAAGLAAKMAAKLAAKKAQIDSGVQPSSPRSQSPVVDGPNSPKSDGSEAKEDTLQVLPPENRVLVKSTAEGRLSTVDKPNKPSKPGRARGATNSTPTTQSSS